MMSTNKTSPIINKETIKISNFFFKFYYKKIVPSLHLEKLGFDVQKLTRKVAL